MMNDVSKEQTQEDAVGKLVKETYHAPHLLVFGDVMTLARGVEATRAMGVVLDTMMSKSGIG